MIRSNSAWTKCARYKEVSAIWGVRYREVPLYNHYPLYKRIVYFSHAEFGKLRCAGGATHSNKLTFITNSIKAVNER